MSSVKTIAEEVVLGAAPLDESNVRNSLPEGECIVWEGRPEARAIATRAMFFNYIIIYLLGIAALRTGYLIAGDTSISTWSGLLAWQCLASLFVVAIICFLARTYSRTTTYTLTSRRLIIRTGAAIPIHVNLPLERLQSADLREFSDGTGDIALKVSSGDRLYWLLLWPNVRSWWIRPLQPLLRGLNEPHVAAAALASVMSSKADVELGDFSSNYEASQNPTSALQST